MLIIIVTIIVLFLALKDDFFEKIIYLFSFNIAWLLLAIVLVVSYLICRAISFYKCTQRLNPDYKFKKSLKLIMDVQFINGITPFAMGGQPYQIYRLKKQGLSLEKGTNITIQDFIVYQIALITLSTIAILINWHLNIFSDIKLLKQLVIIGYIVNLAVIIILFAVALGKKSNKYLLDKLIKIGAKLKIIKNEKKFIEKETEYINNFHESAKELLKSKVHFIKIIIINMIGLILLYLVPFALIEGLGININPIVVLTATAYVMLIGSFIPTPGATGGIEYGFVVFFGTLVPGAKLSSIMIAWRFITYYLPIFVGSITITREEKK